MASGSLGIYREQFLYYLRQVRVINASVGTSIFIFFFAFFSWSSIEFHNAIPLDDWKHHLRADAAGYYIYLPGTFHHGMKANGISEDLYGKAGKGYKLDHSRDRIVTKYTYAPALLMLPFYVIAEFMEGVKKSDGWSRTHHQMIEISGIFYMAFGSLLLFLALLSWSKGRSTTVLLTMVCVIFATNVFYYGYRAPAYSHIYSYFLVSLALYAIFSHHGPFSNRWKIAFMVSTSMLVVTRPSDIVAVGGLWILMHSYGRSTMSFRGFWIPYFFVFLACALPQLAYWKFVHGTWIVYSYGDEGFTHWRSPYLYEVLFAPGNGLVPNAPASLFVALGLPALWTMSVPRCRTVAIVLLAMMAIMIYLCASWHVWTFGCSYGQRSMVQYMPFVGFAIYSLLDRIRDRMPAIFHGLIPLMILIAFINYRAMLNFSTCYGWGETNWYHYQQNILNAFLGSSYCTPP